MGFREIQWKACMAICGGFIVHLTLGTIYTFGNMSPYVTSYLRQRVEPFDVRYQETSIIFALSVTGQGLSIFFGGLLERKLGVRLATLIGGWIMSLGILLSYVTIQQSFVLLTLTYGALVGIGIGVAYAPPLLCAMRWMPKRKGLVNGIVVGGFGGGAFIFNLIQTAFINPDNLVANYTLPGETTERYFDEDVLLDRVPASFLLCGGLYAGMQLIGCLLLCNPPDYKKQPDKEPLIHSQDSSAAVTTSNAELSRNDDPDHNNDRDGTPITTQLADTTPSIHDDPASSGLNLSPREVLKTPAFWILWGTFLLNGQATVFISTLYKAYGQTFISDDLFLALVGSFSAIFNATGRLAWGHLGDVFSYKVAMVSLCMCMCSLMLTMIATPEGGEAMFFIWICTLFFVLSGSFSLLPTATARSFGIEHMGLNYGLVFTSQAITAPVGALLTSALLDVIDWFGMFLLLAGFTFLAGLLTMCFNVRRIDGRPI